MPKYTSRKVAELHHVTKHKTAWEKFTDAVAVFGLGVIGFVVICLIAAASGG